MTFPPKVIFDSNGRLTLETLAFRSERSGHVIESGPVKASGQESDIGRASGARSRERERRARICR